MKRMYRRLTDAAGAVVQAVYVLAMSGRRVVPVVFAAWLATSCSTFDGVAEFGVYQEAYDAAADTGDHILDRLAVAERGLFEIAYPFDPLRSEFDPATAALVSDGADPPATASYRRMLRAIETYNEALFALASGQSAEEIVGKVAQLGAIGTDAATELASFGAGSPVVIGTAVTVNTVIAGFEPLAAELIAFRTREEFREQLVERAPLIREAIEKVRGSTTGIFGALRDEVIVTANNDPTRTGLTDAELDQIRGYRRTLAAWVLLLNGSLGAFEVAVDAARADGGDGSFDGIIMASENLATAVRSAREALAEED